MDKRGATSGHLVMFDRGENRLWNEEVFQRDESEGGDVVVVLGM